MLSILLGSIVAFLYLTATVTGVMSLAEALKSRLTFTGIWLSTIGAFGFALFYFEYLSMCSSVGFKEAFEPRWFILHMVGTLGVSLIHVDYYRRYRDGREAAS